ncbi:MAG: hypothetical protein HQ591_07195 [candidate division Zixibacteria bacterium]|nr:hypothetical protein [Candidatus Tariuqbacter arcticus]
MNRRESLLLTALIIALLNIASAQESWLSYTSMNRSRDIEYYDGAIWAATEGGIFSFSLQDSIFHLITRADGIQGKDAYCMVIDSTGKVWSAGIEAIINIYNVEDGSIYCITSIEDDAQFINDLAVTGNTVFAAADNGVYEIYYDEQFNEYFIKGGYHQFGNFQVGEETKAVFVHDGYLWVGSTSGAARIELSVENKQPAANWQTFTTDDGLPNLPVVGFAAVGDTLYAACRHSGIARFNGDGFNPITAGMETWEIRALEDTIYVACNLGIRRLVDDEWQNIGEGISTCLTVIKTPEGTLWAGQEHKKDVRGGLLVYEASQWNIFYTNTPAGKYISGLLVDSQGDLWCGGTASKGKGVYVFDGIDWVNYTAQDSAYDIYFYNRPQGEGDGPHTFLEYPNGEVWVGSFGSGIAVFLPDGEQIYFAASDSLSYGNVARVYGTANSPNFPVIGEMVLDSENNIWIINRESSANKPLLMVPYDFMVEHSPTIAWLEFTIADIGAEDTYFDYLAIDAQGRLWMGGQSNPATGVRCFDFNGTPNDKADDIKVGAFTYNNNGLLNDAIRGLTIDNDNRLWVVSSGGANYFDIPDVLTSSSGYQFEVNYDLYGKNINCIAVDPMNNKWFGAEEEGVIVLGADNYTILHVYTEETHPLLDNKIMAITFNPVTGEAFIATPEGLSVVQTPYREFTEELVKLQMGPVPFYPGEELLTFGAQSLALGASVRIYTHTGLLVRKLSLNEASLGWDGADSEGQLVGSGVYFVLVVGSDGESLLGKLPVIRR